MQTVETTTSIQNNTNAYFYMQKYVIKYIKDNFDQLSEKYGITKNDFSDLIKNKNAILEWVLGEYLDDNEFKQNGIVIKSGWGIEDENTHTTIYKIGRKFVKSSFKNGDYMNNHKFEFVKPIKKRITIYYYDTVS
jgi:hypothetical protein